MSLSASCVKSEAVVYRRRGFDGQRGPMLDRCRRPPGPGHCYVVMLAHLDLDAFFAAVELHRRPELRGRPLVVGGDPAAAGVVATASYEARRYGIRSAMASAEALRRCPHVVFVRPDHREYRAWSRRVWALVRELAPVVEQIGIDEGYLVLPDGDPREQAELVQQAIRERGAAVVLAGRRHLQGGRQDRLGHAKAGRHHRRAARRGGGVPGAAAGAHGCPGWGRRARSGWRAAGHRDDRRRWPSWTTSGCAALLPGRVGEELRDRGPRHRPARRSAASPARPISISQRGDVRARRARPRGAACPAAAMADELAAALVRTRHERAHRHDQAALPGLLDRHPVAEPRRWASTTPAQIGELACACSTARWRPAPGCPAAGGRGGIRPRPAPPALAARGGVIVARWARRPGRTLCP